MFDTCRLGLEKLSASGVYCNRAGLKKLRLGVELCVYRALDLAMAYMYDTKTGYES